MSHRATFRSIAIYLTAALALTATACSGAGPQARSDAPPTGGGETATGDDFLEPPRPEENKVVYTARTSAESARRIDEAVSMAIEGDVDTAVAALDKILTDDDQAFLAAFNLGVLHDQEGRPGKAKASYERALEIEPDFSPAVLNLVRLEARQGRDPVALADKHTAARPDNLEHQLARLEALTLRSRWDDVVDGARAVLKRDEANPRARYYLALAHYSNARFPLAGYIVDQALEIDTSDPELYFLHGLILLELDDEAAARRAFERAVMLRPDYPEAQNAVGMLLYKNRDFAEAEAAYRMAIRYSPAFQEAWLNLGNALKALDRGDEAEAAYKKALELSPGWADAHFSLGALYLATEVVDLSSTSGMARLEQARTELTRARESFGADDQGGTLATQFLAKADKAIEIRQAELELEKMDAGGGDAGDGGDDPFGDGDGGDGDGDPFGDGGDPFDDGSGGEDDDKGSDGDGDGDPFSDDGDPFE